MCGYIYIFEWFYAPTFCACEFQFFLFPRFIHESVKRDREMHFIYCITEQIAFI